jgi:hypothetical protein
VSTAFARWLTCATWCCIQHAPDAGCAGESCYAEPDAHSVLATAGQRQSDQDGKYQHLEVFCYPARSLHALDRGDGLTDDDLTTIKLGIGYQGWDFEPIAALTLVEARSLRELLSQGITAAERDQAMIAGGKSDADDEAPR